MGWVNDQNNMKFGRDNPSFRPLDTERLYFLTNESGQIIVIFYL